MTRALTDVAFTPSVKAEQERLGSRASYERWSERGGFSGIITSELAGFVEQQTTAYLGTANASGQPYIQHRGGEPGFLRVLDEVTIGFADYAGNRQYITLGNLAENDRAYLFLMDYATRTRVKIWGTASWVEDDPELLARLTERTPGAEAERAILFRVEAWDKNCRQHIPQLVPIEALRTLQRRVADLESEVASLRSGGA
jgi:predicted pyridoxine 5'-phosphate oxidase superfamily flavin-nucleotide-binding protein